MNFKSRSTVARGTAKKMPDPGWVDGAQFVPCAVEVYQSLAHRDPGNLFIVRHIPDITASLLRALALT
jgi:hypothetical protein